MTTYVATRQPYLFVEPIRHMTAYTVFIQLPFLLSKYLIHVMLLPRWKINVMTLYPQWQVYMLYFLNLPITIKILLTEFSSTLQILK